jgi:hypothetical protein
MHDRRRALASATARQAMSAATLPLPVGITASKRGRGPRVEILDELLLRVVKFWGWRAPGHGGRLQVLRRA